ncbi:leucine-rich repeats and immunoglobulin-like domains protein 3 [Caerostris extrusa]|uniref:Leucine-rich repeats and immunoglobulin-like domains protein 3 n=1 Tax=Caerostris extrusa TaxID=172846 RepID=A0AAV4M545_CAEEX|nr:leucine-rich repeats and immunoglobulin-like domains protein 3 [Caerostris extrusa]
MRCRLQKPGIDPPQPEPEEHRSSEAADCSEAAPGALLLGPVSEQVLGAASGRLREPPSADSLDPGEEHGQLRRPRAFNGLNGTLSSLSLLNNKIEEFPTQAVKGLQQLRVLDMGFNRMKTIPEDAFTGNPLLTLLALDGNPLNTLSEASFYHLNSTLRGLSVGGSTLVFVTANSAGSWNGSRNMIFSSIKQHHSPQASTTQNVQTQAPPQRPSVTASGRDLRAPRTSSLDQLHLTEVLRRGSELTVKWEGFREDNLVRARSAAPVHAMYRIFGESHFKLGQTTNPNTGWAQFEVPDGVCGMIIIAVTIFVCCSRRSGRKQAMPRPVMKSEHEWETASVYSGRSIPRARAYHGSVNPSYLHDPRTPDDVQSFRSLPPARAHRGGHMMGNRDIHSSQIALSQLSGHHSFLGTYGGEKSQMDGDHTTGTIQMPTQIGTHPPGYPTERIILVKSIEGTNL